MEREYDIYYLQEKREKRVDQDERRIRALQVFHIGKKPKRYVTAMAKKPLRPTQPVSPDPSQPM